MAGVRSTTSSISMSMRRRRRTTTKKTTTTKTTIGGGGRKSCRPISLSSSLLLCLALVLPAIFVVAVRSEKQRRRHAGGGSRYWTDGEEYSRNNAREELFPSSYEEYDHSVLDPHNVYGSPYGGYSRASRSRLASLPLHLPDISGDDDYDDEEEEEYDDDEEEYDDEYGDEYYDDDDDDDDSIYMKVRDAQGRLFACKVFHEDELEPGSLYQSMFDLPQLRSEQADGGGDDDDDDGNSDGAQEEGGEAYYDDILGDYVDYEEEDADIAAAEEEEEEKKRSKSRRGEKKKKKERPQIKNGPYSKTTESVLTTMTASKLKALKGICGQIHKGWWSYEWCFERHVSQFHIDISSSTSEISIHDISKLGRYKERRVVVDLHDAAPNGMAERVPELARVLDIHTGGDICPDTNAPRKSYVQMLCCSDRVMSAKHNFLHQNGVQIHDDIASVVDIVEDPSAICVYNVTVCTPLLCRERGRGDDDDDDDEYDDDDDDVYEDEDEGVGYGEFPSTSSKERSRKSSKPSFKSASGANKHQKVVQLPRENESIGQILDRSLKTYCLQTNPGGWWTYEFCHGSNIRQYHEVIGTHKTKMGSSFTSRVVESEHVLGLYEDDDDDDDDFEDDDDVDNMYDDDDDDESGSGGGGNKDKGGKKKNKKRDNKKEKEKEEDWKRVVNATDVNSVIGKGIGNGAYYEVEYTGGDVCDHSDVTDSAVVAGSVGSSSGGVERASSVRYYCGAAYQFTVSEDSTCHYVVEVKVPDLCRHPLFKVPVSKKQVVKCLPVSSPW